MTPHNIDNNCTIHNINNDTNSKKSYNSILSNNIIMNVTMNVRKIKQERKDVFAVIRIIVIIGEMEDNPVLSLSMMVEKYIYY